MENEKQAENEEKVENEKPKAAFLKKEYLLSLVIFVSALIVGGSIVYTSKTAKDKSADLLAQNNQGQVAGVIIDENSIIPPEGVELPITWANLGWQMVDKGVIDGPKFESLYTQRGGLDEEQKSILYGENNGKIKITPKNSGFLLNIFWALGLGNKNSILEKGPMSDPRYGGAKNFASTGGWTMAKGDVMNHYSKYNFISLTSEQQALVERVSQGIYRPCCGNSTYFPDCNHGMAMLGLLELMASQGVSEEEMYKIALKVNSYWFPDTYLTIAQYLKEKKNIVFDQADPKEILGANYSSGSGFQAILQQVTPSDKQGGGGCGV